MKKILFILYPLFLCAVTYQSYFFVDQNLHYFGWFYKHFVIETRGEKAVALLLLLLIFFLFYIVSLWLYKKKQLTQKDGIVLIVVTTICLLFAYPAVYSHDIFNYLATAKVSFFYKENPYIIMPIEFGGDPLLAFMHAPNKIALYGPGWIMLTFFPYVLAGGSFIAMLFLFKATVIVFYYFLLYFVYKLSKNFFAVLFVGLNPLVVIETLWSGHNDSVMMALLLAGFYLYRHRRRGIGVLFYVWSILIKYATGILLPLLLLLKYTHKGKPIPQELVYRWSMYGMIGIFLLSSFREEIYPWYAIWFLPFVALAGNKNEKLLVILFTFCLELRYFPYLFLGTHFGITPVLKSLITFCPVGVALAFLVVKKIWQKKALRYS